MPEREELDQEAGAAAGQRDPLAWRYALCRQRAGAPADRFGQRCGRQEAAVGAIQQLRLGVKQGMNGSRLLFLRKSMASLAKISAETRFKLKPDVAFQSLGAAAESVVLSLTSGQLFTANASTTFFLDAVKRGQSVGEASRALCESFEVEPERALADLTALAEQLLSEGLIERLP